MFVYCVDGVENWSTPLESEVKRVARIIPAPGECVDVTYDIDGTLETGAIYNVPDDEFCAAVDLSFCADTEDGIDIFTLEYWRRVRSGIRAASRFTNLEGEK